VSKNADEGVSVYMQLEMSEEMREEMREEMSIHSLAKDWQQDAKWDGTCNCNCCIDST
jgi:hypothetical protein